MRDLLAQLVLRARILKRQGRFRLLFVFYRQLVASGKAAKTVFYGALVSAKVPWLKPYLWQGQVLLGKLYDVVESDFYENDKADRIYSKLIRCLWYVDNIATNSVEALIGIAQAALITGRTDEWLSLQYQIIDRQEKRALAAGLNKYNLRTIDAGQVHSTIGCTLTLDAWIKSGILGLRPAWRSVLLVEKSMRHTAANQCLLDYWRKYFDFVEEPSELDYLRPLYADLRARHDYYIPCGERIIPYSHSASVWIQKQWEMQGRKPLLELSGDHRNRGWLSLERMGVPRGAWFVTIHVRESGFKGAESFRDSDISTYFDAMKFISSRGGWVIRMGDSSMRPLPPIPNVIDYARSADKSDWMDVFLLASARFMIGTSSGPTTVSYAFGVPIAMTNNLPSAATYLGRQDLFLPRLMQRLDDGSFLKFEELMSLPYSMGVIDGMYRNIFRVKTIPNASEEITDLVLEMLDKLDGTLVDTIEDESMQKRFKVVTAEREVLIGLKGFELQCRIGRKFLQRHHNLLT